MLMTATLCLTFRLYWRPSRSRSKMKTPLMVRGALEHFRVAQGTNGVVIAGAPGLLHAGARKLIILRMALVVLAAVDQLHDVVDLVIGGRSQQLRLRAVLQRLGELLEQVGHRPAHPLGIFEGVRAG